MGAETGVAWLWPVQGLCLASLTLLGLRVWPALLLGCALGRWGQEPLDTLLPWLLAAIDTGQSVVGALVLRSWRGFRTDLSRLRDAFAIVIAIGISAAVGATAGSVAIVATGTPAWPGLGRGIATWMVGDGMGSLLVAPPIMAWWRYRWVAPPPPARLIETGALLVALSAAGMVAYFGGARAQVHSPLEYLPFPVAIWAAMRFGIRGATAAILVMAGVALAGNVLLDPPGTAAPGEPATLMIQASLAVGALTALLVGAVTTERDETMRALEESEERATALFAQAPDAIVILDGERPQLGLILAANPAACDLHGIDPSELVGRHLLDIETVSPRDALSEALDRAAAGSRARIDIRHRRADGSTVDVEMHASPFRVGDHRYLVAFDRDVTARRQAETERKRMEEKLQETQKLESLGLLAGGIAHDFNNVLTGILGNANLARTSVSPSEIDAYLEQIERSTERAADLCGQMLAYAGKGRLEVTQVDVSVAVQETTSLVRTSLGPNVTLDLQLAPDLPLVDGDPTQIRQIVMNLVLNASEAIDDRPGAIRITTGSLYADPEYLATTHLAPDLPGGTYVYLEVADTGRGMSQDTVARIFDPFFSTKFTGRGLGLAAVLGIVRAHKGALRVESAEGQGTVFKLLLPAAAVQVRPAERAGTPALSWRGRGIALVVDDEPSVRLVATRMLAAIGLDVVTAANGQEAVERLAERPADFSIALLDLTMPGVRGDETYQQLRAIKPGLPIILMSGYSHQEASARFEGAALAGFLQKPFRLDRLRDLVRNAIGDPREAAMGAGKP